MKKYLHSYIDTAADAKLAALYAIIENDLALVNEIQQEELDILYKRAEQHLKGETKIYTIKESHNMIRQQRKKIAKSA